MSKSVKVLYVLNAFYPYQTGESFLETEIDYYQGFDKIVIVPVYAKVDQEKIGINYNKAIRSKLSYLDVSNLKKISRVLKYGLKSAFSAELYHEIGVLYKSKRISLCNLIKLIRFMIRGIYCVDTVISDINRNTNSNDKIVLYSYWMNLDAYIGAKLKVKIKNRIIDKFVTRCHRVDIYEYAECTKYIPMRNYIFDNVDYILSISDDGKEYLMNNYGLVEENIKVMRLGTFDKGERYSPKGKRLKIISCSWIRPIKRIELIIEALKNVTIPIEWIHYGDGEGFENIKTAIDKLNNQLVHCTLAGKKINKEILNIYASEDFNIFINVSENEGVPVSIMEAMSFGKIVIATNVGGTGEIVFNSQNGFLLEKEFNVGYLTKIFENIYNMSSEEYLKMCRESRRIWNDKCNADINYGKFVEFLNCQ